MATAPEFDPELYAALLATGETSIATGITPDQIVAQRDLVADGVISLDQLRADHRIEVEEITVPATAATPDVSLLVLRPRGATQPLPIVYHTHGGGLILGNNRYGIDVLLDWVTELDVVLVSVEYRLAPENPYPAGLDDAYAGLVWTVAHADRIGGDAHRVVLAGASAGGNLAAALALLTRDRGGPGILGQLLIYPMLDNHNNSVSGHDMVGLGVWDRVSNQTAWDAYLADLPGEVPAYASPSRAVDLSGLPPTYLEVGTAETFRDEVTDYARRLWEAGADAEFHVWAGAYHGFELFAPDARLTRRALATRKQWLRQLIGE